MRILVTGGAGYIGSHTLVELLATGHDIVVLDNLCNSSPESIRRVEQITEKKVEFIHGDIRDRVFLDRVFQTHQIEAVIHFAGLKAVGESVQNPLDYYDNNVNGSLTLCQAMAAAQVFRLVFSSSATVYGDPEHMPIAETCPVGVPTNPYGYSKLMVEQILKDLVASDPRWSVALLRYFNPVGAHASGMIGEDPHGLPNNLTPYISQVVIGKLKQLSVYGNDYPTHDGTGVRDYIHVVDLAKGHMAALNFIYKQQGAHVWNLGTGVGYSVLEVVAAFEKAANHPVPYRIVPRRAGDVARSWSDPSKAFQDLGWQATLSLKDMVDDAWRWQVNNPNGYQV
jgi:UDP-glucose 4-epimerase